MYRLLIECGEDTSCGCGCGEKPEKLKGKKVLTELPKKKTEAEISDEEVLSERRRVGVRVFKVIRKLRGLGPAKRPKVGKLKAPKSAIRAIARNRHRGR